MASGYKDFVAGGTLTAADLEDYCELQGVLTFASAAARDSALASVLREGLNAYLVDVNTLTVYSGTAWSTVGPVHGAWTAYTPTWTAPSGTAPAIGNGTLDGAHTRIGRAVTVRARALFGTTSTYGSVGAGWRISVPFAAATTYPIMYISCIYQLAGTQTNYTGVFPVGVSNGTAYISCGTLSNTTGAWQSGDYVMLSGTYEAGADA